MENSAVMQFSFFIVFALLGTLLSMRLRQPYVVGLLILGMVAGPNFLGMVSDEGLILVFSELGAILLLFAVGIEFSVSRLIKQGFRAAVITLAKMSVLFFFGYEIALYFGLDLTTALFVGAMMSITSTAILFKIVSEKGLGKNPVLPLLFSMLIVEDVVAVAALTFFSSIGASPTYEDKFASVLVSLGLLGAFYLMVRKPVAASILRLTSTLSQETMIFVSFSLCLAMSMVASFFGLSPAIGAFLAGSIVASLPNSRAIERSIKPLLLMFAALFFLSLGMRIDIGLVTANFWLAAALTLAFAIVCFLAILWLLYSTGSSAGNAVFGASAMVVLGEFSLLIASLAPGQAGPLLLAVGSFGVVATAFLSSLLLDRRQAIMEFGQRRMPRWAASTLDSASAYFTGLLRDFSPNGILWMMSKAFWKLSSRRLSFIAAIALLAVVARIAISYFGMAEGAEAARLKGAVLLIALLPIAYFGIGILRDFRVVLDTLAKSVSRHRKNAKDEEIILRNLAVAAILLLAAIAIPDLSAYLQLPGFFGFGDEILFLFAFAFLWDLLRHASRLHLKRR